MIFSFSYCDLLAYYWRHITLKMEQLIKAYLLVYNLSQVLGWFYLNYIALPYYTSILESGSSSSGMYQDTKDILRLLLLIPYLEVFHAVTGLVKSSPVPTFFQVTMRAFVFMAICEHYETVQPSIQFSTMVLVWNMSEIIRYAYYATNLIGIPLNVLTWLRYTLFIILYPIGAGSELLCMYVALPDIKRDDTRNIAMPNKFNVTFNFYYLVIILMVLYFPGFPQMYCHMLRQRRKVLGRPSQTDGKKSE